MTDNHPARIRSVELQGLTEPQLRMNISRLKCKIRSGLASTFDLTELANSEYYLSQIEGAKSRLTGEPMRGKR
jgi:hypothetical protein